MNLKNEIDELQNSKSNLLSLMNSVNACNNVDGLFELLNSVKPHLSELKDNQLEEVQCRLKTFKLDELLICLRQLNHYLNVHPVRIDQFYELNQTILKFCKDKLVNSVFDRTDTQLIDHCFSIYFNQINDENYVVVNYLTKKLLALDYEFNFDLAVKLLKKIKQNHETFKKLRKKVGTIENDKLRYRFDKIEKRYRKKNFFNIPNLTNLIEKANADT